METLYIEPGSPWENGYAESIPSRLQDEFENLKAARQLTAAWKREYNDQRPHSSLGYVTPAAFAARRTASAPGKAPPFPPLQQHSDLTQLVLS